MPLTAPRTTPAATKTDRRTSTARTEAARLRAQQHTRARRARTLAISSLVAAVVVLVVVVAVVLHRAGAVRETYADVTYGAGQTVQAPALTDVTGPTTADDRGGVPVSSQGVGTTGDAPVDVTVYLDFMCPFCGQFETANGPMLDERVAAGDIAVTYRVVSFLDPQSAGGAYSTRAANAAAVVADLSPDQYPAFVAALFAHQPAEGTPGLTDAQIAELAQDAGVPSSVTDRFTATTTGTFTTTDDDQGEGTWRTYAPWLVAVTEQAAVDLGGLSTPTVLVDGERFTGDPTSPTALEAVIDAALAGRS